MKKTVLAALCATTLGVSACGLEVEDLNNPSLSELLENPTPTKVNAATTGLLIGSRNGKAATNGYVAHLGILGRESYTFDPGDARFVTEMLGAPTLDPGSPAFGGNLWNQPYANIRNANILLTAVDKVANVSAPDKEAIRGFAKTMQALDFLMIVVTRDTNGGPIDVGGDDYTQPAPLESKEALLAHVVTLLDEAKGHLQAAGPAFPFPLGSGFKGIDTPAASVTFNTPVTFLTFNRAVKARAEVYRKQWTSALQALGESFIDEELPMTMGVYYAFGAGSGDTTNSLNSPNIFAHPSVVTEAERKPDCTDDARDPFKCLDTRVRNKIKVTEARTYQGLTSQYMFRMYENNTAPVPIIRNEDLLLLRAEANIQLNNLPAAQDDINLVRGVSGGLVPVALTSDNAVGTLLKERRYSLLFEGGHRWIDMRRYELLSTLPKDKPEHSIHERFPIPVADTDARD